ncbi:MAG: hypothetical protein V1816_14770 [Pseudomonadota bacterium]
MKVVFTIFLMTATLALPVPADASGQYYYGQPSNRDAVEMPSGPGWSGYDPADMPPAPEWDGPGKPTKPWPQVRSRPGAAGPERLRDALFFRLEYWLNKLELAREQRAELVQAVLEPLSKLNQLEADRAAWNLKLLLLREKHDVDPEEVKGVFAELGRIEGEIFLVKRLYEQAVESVIGPELLKWLKIEILGEQP